MKSFSATWNWLTWLQKETDKKGCDLCGWRKSCRKKGLGGNYLVNPGILSVINGPIWHFVRDHLKSSGAIWTCRTCQSAITNIGGFHVTLSLRFKCDTSKHISTLCNAGHGASRRSVHICQWNKCVSVESRQQRSFQWSILNQQTQLHGRS